MVSQGECLRQHSADTFQRLWQAISFWQCYFWVSDGNPVYPIFIPDGDQIVSKTYRTRVEGENTRLRHYLARLHRQTLCYSKCVKMLENSLLGLRQKTNREKPQLQSPLGIYFEKPKIAETQIYQGKS